MSEKRIEELAQKISGLSDAQILDMAGKRAEKVIFDPSERAGQARSKIPEQIAHLLTRIYKDERSRRQGPGPQMDNKVFRELESFCQEHSTTLCPFDILASIETDMTLGLMSALAEAGDQLRIRAEKVSAQIPGAPHTASAILENAAMALFEIQKVINIFGCTIDDLKFMGRNLVDQEKKAAKKR